MTRLTQALIVVTALSLGVLFSQAEAGAAPEPQPNGQGQAIGPGLPFDPNVVTDGDGHFAAAWYSAHDTKSSSRSQLLVMIGQVGSKARVVRALSPADRDLAQYDIALDAAGGAVVTWTDAPVAKDSATPPTENWYMARVDPGGEVVPMGHFTGAYEVRRLLRTGTGGLVAFAERHARIYVSTLEPGASTFTEPAPGPKAPAHAEVLRVAAADDASATLVWWQYRSGKSNASRLLEQRIGFTGEALGRPHAVSEWGRLGFSSFDGYGGQNAFSWQNRRGDWVSTGVHGHLRAARLRPRRRLEIPDVKLTRTGRVFLIANSQAHGGKARQACGGLHRGDLIAAEVRGDRLVHVRRLDRGSSLDSWRLLRTASGSVAAAVWVHGRRLRATRFGAGSSSSKTHSIRVNNFDYDAAMVGKDGLLVAVAETARKDDPVALVKVRFLRL